MKLIWDEYIFSMNALLYVNQEITTYMCFSCFEPIVSFPHEPVIRDKGMCYIIKQIVAYNYDNIYNFDWYFHIVLYFEIKLSHRASGLQPLPVKSHGCIDEVSQWMNIMYANSWYEKVRVVMLMLQVYQWNPTYLVWCNSGHRSGVQLLRIRRHQTRLGHTLAGPDPRTSISGIPSGKWWSRPFRLAHIYRISSSRWRHGRSRVCSLSGCSTDDMPLDWGDKWRQFNWSSSVATL